MSRHKKVVHMMCVIECHLLSVSVSVSVRCARKYGGGILVVVIMDAASGAIDSDRDGCLRWKRMMGRCCSEVIFRFGWIELSLYVTRMLCLVIAIT